MLSVKKEESELSLLEASQATYSHEPRIWDSLLTAPHFSLPTAKIHQVLLSGLHELIPPSHVCT